nr:MAG TPA: hypothetical protein [Bacteriophage sp.]
MYTTQYTYPTPNKEIIYNKVHNKPTYIIYTI